METVKAVCWIILFGVAIIVIGIIGLRFAFRRWPRLRRKMMARLQTCPDAATFMATRKALRSSIENRLQAADADTRSILEKKLTDINHIIDNADDELPKARECIFRLKCLLNKQGKAIDKARLVRATEALEIEDYRSADIILAEIATDPEIKVKSAARVAFGRGEIARLEFKWQDAAKHYGKSARLVPGVVALLWSSHFLDRLELHKQAASVGEELVALARKEYGNASKTTINALSDLAYSHYASGDYSLAELRCREVLAIIPKGKGEDYPEYILSLQTLVLMFEERGEYASAEPYLRELLKFQAETIGKAHPDYSTSLSRLAILLDNLKEYGAAETLYREVLEISENTIGRDHPKYVTRLLNLAQMLKEKEDYDAAEPLYREALEIEAKTVGTDHTKYAARLNNLAMLLKNKGDYEAAEPLYREALSIDANTLGKNSTRYALHLANLADLWRLRGNLQTAAPMFREALGVYAETTEGYHYCYAVHLANFAKLLQSQSDFTAAEALLRQVVTMTEAGLGADHSDSKSAKTDLEDLLQGMP